MRSSRTLWAACLAQLLVVLDTSIVNVALPTIQRRLDLSPSEVSWVALAYTLGFAGVLLVGARLGDRLRPARALMWGMVAFAVASLVGGIADSGVLLIFARAAQGVCAAVVSPATLTLLTTTYPEGARRVRALAIWTAVSLAGGGIGNVLGGILTQWVSWRGVFLIAVPVAAMVVIGVRPLCGAEPARQKVRVPLTGALLVTAALALVTYVLSSAAERFADASWVAVAACSAVLAGTAIWQQWRSEDPLIPRALWRSRAIVTGNAAILVTGMCFQVSVWFFLTFLMQQHLGYDAFTTGLAFLPLTVVMLVVNTWVTPQLLRRGSAKIVSVLGMLIAAIGFAAQAVVRPDEFIVAILLPSTIIGIGGGLFNTPLTTIVTGGVATENAGAASGMMNVAKQFGGALGISSLTAIGTTAGNDRSVFVAMSVLMAVSIVLTLAIPNSHRGTNTDE